jgi:hypothetical protein
MQMFHYGGCNRTTDLFRLKVRMASVLTPNIHSCEYKDVQNKLHIKSIQVLCAKIEDTALSSGISYHVVHRESTDVSEEHVISIFRNQHEAEL